MEMQNDISVMLRSEFLPLYNLSPCVYINEMEGMEET